MWEEIALKLIQLEKPNLYNISRWKKLKEIMKKI
jgi:hypothetical protein